MTHSRPYGLAGGEGVWIISYLRLIVREAIQLSPTTSPVKGAAARDVSLKGFNDPLKAESFDFEIGMVELIDDEPIPDFIDILYP